MIFEIKTVPLAENLTLNVIIFLYNSKIIRQSLITLLIITTLLFVSIFRIFYNDDLMKICQSIVLTELSEKYSKHVNKLYPIYYTRADWLHIYY